jgi:hypothetical protein
MKVEIDIPDFLPDEVLDVPFEDGAIIEGYRSQYDDAIGIRANSAGLISLAKHLLELSQECVSSGAHIHYNNEYLESLSSESVEIIIDKYDFPRLRKQAK